MKSTNSMEVMARNILFPDTIFEAVSDLVKPANIKTPVHHMHGPNFDDCSICHCEINDQNPGKLVTTQAHGYTYKDHVCNDCFYEEDYQQIVKRSMAKVKDYNL